MTRPFKISLGINGVLAALLLWSARPHNREKIETVAVVPTASVPAPAPSAEPVHQPAPFRWAHLESTNYRTYIANLRGIECPEQTIRDIVVADVDEAYYASRRDQLKRNGSSLSVRNELDHQEATLIAALFNEQLPGPVRDIADSSNVPKPLRTKSQAERELDRAVSTPLVMQSMDLEALNLNAAQKETIEALRQNFLAEIGGTNQDPNDPSYRQHWLAAQREADNMLVGLLGRKFAQNLQDQLEKSAPVSK